KVKSQKSKVLEEILEKLLVLWHPFIPFVTEAIWTEMLGKKNLIVAEWPSSFPPLSKGRLGGVLKDFEKLKDVITKIRNLRAENKIGSGKVVNVEIASKDEKLFQDNSDLIEKLSRSKITLKKLSGGARIKLLTDKIDKEKNKTRLQKELEEKEKYLAVLNKKLLNKEFVAKAPKQVVDAEKGKQKKAEEEIKNIKEQLKSV
ncbi:class I tRNA ligase family protein, partial [Patescibacteria group bacterium]|nr:class I tRNA ligase family protein [Patescibacteria group bacterium]